MKLSLIFVASAFVAFAAAAPHAAADAVAAPQKGFEQCGKCQNFYNNCASVSAWPVRTNE
jgi:hypothetical protein